MKNALRILFMLTIVGIAVLPMVTSANDRGKRDDDLKATLRGTEEPPAVSSTGKGTFRGEISEDETSITWSLSYEGLEGDVQQSHIHLGQKGVNGASPSSCAPTWATALPERNCARGPAKGPSRGPSPEPMSSDWAVRGWHPASSPSS
jgi:hypothetical protein